MAEPPPGMRSGEPSLFPDQPTAFTVSQLVGRVKGAVESGLGYVWIKGEVASLKAYASGHWYFTLCDAESSIRCVMWKTYTTRVGAKPADGTEVYVLAGPTVREDRAEIQLKVQVLLPTAGVGVQQLNRERSRAVLAKEGLLDPARKRGLPEFPATIAVVTSSDGAALRDIIHVARKRWPAIRLLLVPAKVQGEDAPRELVQAFRVVNRLERADLCIVGRGGGAREDLAAFDDVRVCRALAGLRIPVISAVGHETDISLTDLVADARAATPSAAMEMALPDRAECLRHVGALSSRLVHGLTRRTRLVTARLARTGDRIRVAISRRLTAPQARLDRLAGALEALSPLKVLGRGYAVAQLGSGRVARRAADLPPGTRFSLRLQDGSVPSRAED